MTNCPNGAVVEFYYSGVKIPIRREGMADDDKFVGSVGKDKLFELFQAAKASEASGGRPIILDF